ncbi:MAG: arginine--tRNA ligase [Bdellovibrionales bacterium]|nr:arginine--tRNA ligase [Bdellovibrionales bacterium]
MRPFIRELHALIHQATGHQPAPTDWAPTPNRALGDFAYPCFKLGKERGKAPALMAQELAAELKKILPANGGVKDIVPTGPYVNVFFTAAKVADWIQTQLSDAHSTLGATNDGGGENLVLDFSSPNTAKEIGLHHLRSTAIGNALANLGELHGYKAVRINYLGDWGTSHGKNIMALKLFGSEDELHAKGLPYILDLYVRYNNELKAEQAAGSTKLADAAKDAFRRLEQGDPECRRIWALEKEISVREAKRLYDRLGIRFDHFDGESLYENKLQAIVDEVTAKVGTRHSEGALVCDLPGHKIPVLLQKDDGASLYMTRDLVAAEDRFTRFHYKLSFYVVAIQQKLHFEQLFGVLKQLGKNYAERCEHIPFGMLSFGDKTMKSREGNILFLSDVLDEAKKRALEIIREKNAELPDAENVAEMIGQGAILFTDLAQNRTRDISFDWNKALSFEGDTAPFLQYTHARCCSLTAKAQQKLATLAPGQNDAQERAEFLDSEPAIRQLLGDIAFFQTYSERAWAERDPSQIATATLNVAKSFGQLYHKVRFLDQTSHARLRALIELTDNTRRLVAHGLKLLGIRAPREM